MANNKHLMSTYAPLPVTFSSGNGALLTDTEGKQYLDALSGIAVCGLGHAHPAVAKAISEQAGKLIHTSNLYEITNQQNLADKLCELSGLDRVFFSNSGAEANEAAIKLARLYGHQKNIDVPTIVVMENSFHGRTMATLSATGSRKVQAGFEPLVQGFVRAPFNDVEAIENIAKNNSNIVAVMVEPVQGESGIQIPDADYLNKLRELCDQNEWLLMLDEIQTGMGRTGEWFAHQHNNIKPDVMTLAKALGNGVPIGACLAAEKAASVMKPGNHGSTFGGNPLACAAGLAVIETMLSEQLVSKARDMGAYLLTALQKELAGIEGVREVRGLGLMLGIELDQPCTELFGKALEDGLLLAIQADTIIRLLPPLILTKEQADTIVQKITPLVINLLQQEAA
ncbi:MAG: aspartate aminotransferase family protein [Gammaproteobacteria bacterium]|nr:aspartate aminotransferase family protein [Gammaproteobacteria bacterium]MCW8922378.1 aspartate aminotransferase family protein [Gammaproteobacteria bacterium]